jgi:protein SCO1/2
MRTRLRKWLGLTVLVAASLASAHARPSLFSVDGPWVDETGQRTPLSRWQGRPAVVAMEYSACRFICSVYWRRLMDLQQEADRRGVDLQFVILSIDPEHDTPAAWREYRQARNLQRANWHFLTSDRTSTTRAAALLGVHWWYADGHLMHDFKVVRLDTQGGVAAALTTYDEPVTRLLEGL